MSKYSVGKLEYDKRGAAEYLGTSLRHLERLIAERKIPYRKVGRFHRWTQADLDAIEESSYFEAINSPRSVA